jgi:hypothetical protein
MISSRAKRAGLKELEIFDNFQIDNNLPKYTNVEDPNLENTITFGNATGSMSTNNVIGGSFITLNGNPSSGVWLTQQDDTPSWLDGSVGDTASMPTKFSRRVRIINWLLKKMQGEHDKDEKKKEALAKTKLISITEFFLGLTQSHQELTPIAEISEHYEKALLQAKTLGQVALAQKLADAVQVVRGEAHLIVVGLKQYVTERQVVDFYEKTGEDKCLKLTWIKNFNRIIPEDVYDAKKKADERKIFDNYVILHYDPLNTGEVMTKEEVEKKKDPILFGLIKNSRKLYYVADWKDDYCQLTLEEMFSVLGEKVLKINNKNVKTFIDKIKA